MEYDINKEDVSGRPTHPDINRSLIKHELSKATYEAEAPARVERATKEIMLPDIKRS